MTSPAQRAKQTGPIGRRTAAYQVPHDGLQVAKWRLAGGFAPVQIAPKQAGSLAPVGGAFIHGEAFDAENPCQVRQIPIVWRRAAM